MQKRPRRNRRTPAIRSLVEENHLDVRDLVAPFFVLPGKKQKAPISSMPGIFRLSEDLLLSEIEKLHRAGVQAVILFPVISQELKDPMGKEALNEKSFFLSVIRTLKKEIPTLCVMTDIALDPFTSHGHDGLVDERGTILNDATIEILKKTALLHAEQGVDFVAPSDMMDGRVSAIR